MGSNESKPDEDLESRVLRDLQCPVCLETCRSPIYMCINGHNVCPTCQFSLTQCPVCRTKGQPNIRNRFADDMRARVIRKCKNAEDGCEGEFSAKNMIEHLLVCESELLYDCKICNHDGSKCNYLWTKSELKEHAFKTHRGRFLIGENPAAVKLNIYNGNNRIYLTRLVEAFGELFWFVLEYTNVELKLVASSYFVGVKDMAKKYKAKIVLCSSNADQKLTYTAVMRHVRERIFMDERCTTFQISKVFLREFKDMDGNINVLLKVFKV